MANTNGGPSLDSSAILLLALRHWFEGNVYGPTDLLVLRSCKLIEGQVYLRDAEIRLSKSNCGHTRVT